MNTANRVASIPILFGCAVLAAGMLTIGVLTPFLAAVACAAAVANLVIASHFSNIAQVVPVLDAAALSLLGPGAYSLDARMFGRRVVTMPPRKSSDDV